MTAKSSISLTDDQHSFAKTLVDSGHVPSVSAVVQQGILLLRERTEDETLERTALAEILIDEAFDHAGTVSRSRTAVAAGAAP